MAPFFVWLSLWEIYQCEPHIEKLSLVLYFEHLCLIIFNFYKLVSRITLSQVLLTMSLQFVASTYQSVGLNVIPSLVFVMALIFRQEKLKCWSINGQAKIWGLVLSAAGALTIVLWKGPVVLNSVVQHSINQWWCHWQHNDHCCSACKKLFQYFGGKIK